jgi:hypothetical protein
MRKNAPLAFRISDDLKSDLQQIAESEARSVSQLCEILLKLGVESYRKDGPKYLQRFLSRRKESPT